MTKKDFFATLVKIFALLSLISSIFSVLPNSVYYTSLSGIDIISVLSILVIVILFFCLFLFILFKADLIVKFLKLDKGFDNELIDFGNIKPNDIIKIGVFIIGGLLLIDNLPEFLSHLFFAFKGDLANSQYDPKEKFNWAVSGIKLILGYLLFTNYDFIAKKFKTENIEQ
jgi:hypothetical protein